MATPIQEIATVFRNTDELESLIRALPVGVILAEAPGGRLVAANARAEQIWRGTLPLVASMDEYNRYFVGYRQNGREYAEDEWPISRALRDGEVVVDEEIEFRFSTGARRILQVSAAPVRDESNEIRAAFAIFHDVTETRQEERRRDFLMQLTDGMRVLDDPVAIMEMAAAATGEQLGVASVSYADVAAGGRTAHVHAEYRNGRMAQAGRYDLEEFGPQLQQHLLHGDTLAIEDLAADPRSTSDMFDGRGIRSTVVVPLLRQGRLRALFTVLHDAPRRWTRSDISLVEQVAERTAYAVETARTQTDLRQSREWLTLALRAGSAAIWEWDVRTGQIHWSEEDDAVLGLKPPRRSLTFDRWLALVHPDDRETARAAARRVATIREGEIELEYRLVGAHRWVTMRGRVILDARGVPVRVVGVAVDTTVRKAAELEREQALREAREASDAKSHFISVLSHEFRTPLTAIIGYTDLLSTGISGALTPSQARQLDRIRASAWHLTQMVDEILTFSRIEGGRETCVTLATDVPSLVREAIGLISPAAAAKGVALACELPDEPITLHTDGVKLRQVLLNLLGNGVKFTEKGGVTLRVRRLADVVEFVVQDTGIGIPPEDMSHIFERFWQAQHGAAHVVSGAGLGLTVSQHLTRLLGGTLTAESDVGVGSTFRLTLPITH